MSCMYVIIVHVAYVTLIKNYLLTYLLTCTNTIDIHK